MRRRCGREIARGHEEKISIRAATPQLRYTPTDTIESCQLLAPSLSPPDLATQLVSRPRNAVWPPNSQHICGALRPLRYNHTACMHVRRKQACSSCASPKTCDSRAHLLVWSTKGRARHRRAHAQSLAPTKWLAHGLNCARIGRGARYGSAQRADWRARTAHMGAPDPDPPGRCSACVEAVWLVCRGGCRRLHRCAPEPI